MVASAAGGTVSTILGSCVSVVLWDAVARVGGVNHYVMPRGMNGDAVGRYGNLSIRALHTRVISSGASARSLVARVFGGAHALASRGSGRHVGDDNVEIAMSTLSCLDVRVVSRDTGGACARRLMVDLNVGLVQLSRIETGEYEHR
jgi:chemotaxis protein CheD